MEKVRRLQGPRRGVQLYIFARKTLAFKNCKIEFTQQKNLNAKIKFFVDFSNFF